jgi:hypothetical protein
MRERLVRTIVVHLITLEDFDDIPDNLPFPMEVKGVKQPHC